MLVPGVISICPVLSGAEDGKSFTIIVFPLTNTCPNSSPLRASIEGQSPQVALLPKTA